MKKKYFLIILLFSLLTSCGQLNVQNSCNCEIEQNSLAEVKAELAKLKRLRVSKIDISSKKLEEPFKRTLSRIYELTSPDISI